MKYPYILILLFMKYILHFGKKVIKTVFSTQYIRNIENHRTFSELDKDCFLNENPVYKNKKLISISPGGYKGIYLLGTCMYIKEHFNLDNYIFSGASAGSWNSLVMSYRKDPQFLKTEILEYSLQNSKSAFDIEMIMKKRILDMCSVDDFDLEKLFIGVTTLHNYKPNTTIFYGFTNLEDAINCCIASSHIPFVTGGIVNKYKDMYTFDGGFSKYPYLNITNSVLHLTPSIWLNQKENENIIKDITDYTTLFSKEKYNFSEMLESGYKHAHENRAFLKYVLDVDSDE